MKKKGQVWIETVLYTLIGLTLLGLALGFIMPKINEARDRALVEQAISSLSDFDGKINEVIQTGVGNVRQTDFLMKKGEFYVNSSNNEILLTLTGLVKPYSEPGIEIDIGRIKVKSEVGQRTSTVYLRTTYSEQVNITYKGLDEDRKFTPASTSYKFSIDNKGTQDNQIWIDLNEISNR